jgi:1-deoxy-D-xylulose-5-phosphate reductoisomerase
MDTHRVFHPNSIEEILEADSWARKKALEEIKK